MAGPQFMDREKLRINVARLKKSGENFEVVVEPDDAIAFKKGKIADVRDVLKSEEIFSDAKKGFQASEDRVKSLFGTDNPLEVAATIIKEGEIQLTQDQRHEIREQKRKQIIQLIKTNAVDSKTGNPHTEERIEAAMRDAQVRIDDNASAEAQLDGIVEKLRPLLPISFSVKRIEVKVPQQYASQCFGFLKKFAKVLKSDWGNDGSLTALMDIPGGLETDFYEKLNAMTHGNNECNVR